MDESTRFFCVGCGVDQPRPAGFTQMDDRYAVGFCDTCTDNKPRKTARPKSQFIRADLFDRDKWTEQKERATLRKHVTALGSAGNGLQLMSDRAIWEMVTLFDKYGSPGWSPSPEIRGFAESYGRSIAGHKPKPKRGRGA